MTETEKVTKKMIIAKAIDLNPKVAEIMFEHGLHCIGCAVSANETIEDGCKVHQMSDEQIDKMIEQINKSIEKDSKK